MRAKQFITEESSKGKERFVEMFSKFLPLAMHYLKLDNLPKIVFKKNIKSTGQPTFGMYVTGENVLYVALVNRHPNDILRTVAHELQHYKQDTQHQLDDESGTTGSAEENEANAMAGIVMRHFNKQYPEYLGDRPVIAESWTKKYKNSIDCSNPKGFSQRAHCQGRKKSEDYHPNERPAGPETKPTMPAGTVKVDVSDVYDWYKLGMHISDLKGLGHHDFGQGPPSAIFSFGSEDEEHKYINDLKKIGLTTTDIDPVDPKQPRGMKRQKTDPTYNVGENFADGRNPQDKGDSKRHGVPTKASVSTLRKVAKQGGRKGQLAHWMANMKAGRAKKK